MSVKVGIPGVNKAVSKLQELADRMRSADFGFRNDDVDNIDKIINALYQLEEERQNMRAAYEKESIKAALLRHQSKQILTDVKRADGTTVNLLLAAEKTNKEKIHTKQKQKIETSDNSAELENRAKEEYAQFLEEEASQESPEEALRTVMMDPDDKEDISKLEKLLNAKKERLEKETPIFQYSSPIDYFLGEKNPLAETREYLREAREAYVVQLKEYGEVTKAKEKEIFTVGCKVRALMEVNERIEEANKKHEAALGKMNETEGIEHLQAELIRQRKEVATLREQDDVMHTVFAARIKFFRDALEPLKREFSHHDKLDDIIRRLLKGMRVLTDFLRDITSEGKPALMPTEKQEDGKQEPGTDKQSAAKRARRELPEWPSQPRCSVQQGAGKLPRRGALKRRPTMHHRALHELCIEFVEDTPDVHVDVSEIDDEEPLPPRDPTSPNISDKRLTLPNVSVKRLSMPNINDKRSSLIYHRRYALPDVSDMRAALLNITGKRPTLPQPDDKDSAQPEVDDKDSAKPEVDDKDTTQPNVDDKDTAQPEVDDKIITPPRVEDEDSAKPNVSRKDLRKPRVHSKRPKKATGSQQGPQKAQSPIERPQKATS
nr:hypothetical protein BaRGS_008325 [Batillaria attramentaria]